MGEKQLEKRLAAEASRLGGIALKLTSMTMTGLPDRMVLMPGCWVGFVELKSFGKKPSPRQLVMHKMLRKLGFEVRVIDNPDALKAFIDFLEFAI